MTASAAFQPCRVRVATGSTPPFSFLNRVSVYFFLCFPMECGSCRGRLLASGFAACRKPKAVVRCGSGVFMQEELESLGARVWTGGACPPTRHKLRFPELVLPCTPFPHGFQACLQDLLWPADTSSRDPSRGPTGPVT